MENKRISEKFNKIKSKIVFWLLKRIAIFVIKYTKHPDYYFELGFSVEVNGIRYPVLFHCDKNIEYVDILK